MNKEEKWYENISFITLFLDTPLGTIALLKNKRIKTGYKIGGCIVGIIGIIAAITNLA